MNAHMSVTKLELIQLSQITLMSFEDDEHHFLKKYFAHAELISFFYSRFLKSECTQVVM